MPRLFRRRLQTVPRHTFRSGLPGKREPRQPPVRVHGRRPNCVHSLSTASRVCPHPQRPRPPIAHTAETNLRRCRTWGTGGPHPHRASWWAGGSPSQAPASGPDRPARRNSRPCQRDATHPRVGDGPQGSAARRRAGAPGAAAGDGARRAPPPRNVRPDLRGLDRVVAGSLAVLPPGLGAGILG